MLRWKQAVDHIVICKGKKKRANDFVFSRLFHVTHATCLAKHQQLPVPIIPNARHSSMIIKSCILQAGHAKGGVSN
jgi:hypothetical protein